MFCNSHLGGVDSPSLTGFQMRRLTASGRRTQIRDTGSRGGRSSRSERVLGNRTEDVQGTSNASGRHSRLAPLRKFEPAGGTDPLPATSARACECGTERTSRQAVFQRPGRFRNAEIQLVEENPERTPHQDWGDGPRSRASLPALPPGSPAGSRFTAICMRCFPSIKNARKLAISCTSGYEAPHPPRHLHRTAGRWTESALRERNRRPMAWSNMPLFFNA